MRGLREYDAGASGRLVSIRPSSTRATTLATSRATSRVAATTAALATALLLAACGGSGDGSGGASGEGSAGGDTESRVETEGTRVEDVLMEELEKHGHTHLHHVTIAEHGISALAYGANGELFDVVLHGPDLEQRENEPFEEVLDDGRQIRVASPLEEVSFADDYDAAREALADCTEDSRVTWEASHDSVPVARGFCGPDANSPLHYLRWGDRTWTDLPTDLMSTEGLAFLDEFIAHLDLEQIESINLTPASSPSRRPTCRRPNPTARPARGP